MRVSISGIKQAIEDNIDYSWTKPQTYLVLVPVISLIIQRIKFSKALPLITINGLCCISPNISNDQYFSTHIF